MSVALALQRPKATKTFCFFATSPPENFRRVSTTAAAMFRRRSTNERLTSRAAQQARPNAAPEPRSSQRSEKASCPRGNRPLRNNGGQLKKGASEDTRMRVALESSKAGRLRRPKKRATSRRQINRAHRFRPDLTLPPFLTRSAKRGGGRASCPSSRR